MADAQGHFIWYELMTTDANAAARFYGTVVGWSIGAAPSADSGEQDYRMIVRDDGGNAGGVLKLTQEMLDGGAAPTWMPYLSVADVDAALLAIRAEGGTVQMPATDIAVGRIAMVTDPQGVPIYVMDPIPPEDAPDTLSDVFSPDAEQRVGWNELESPDLEASKAFYARHFGFEFNEVMSMGEAGDYCFIDRGGARLGAIMQQQAKGSPAAWQFYFRVPSIGVAKNNVENSGGTVMMGPHEVPGDDWIIVASDPQGAVFGLVAAHE